MHAPALLDVEVAQVVRCYATIGEINDRVAARAIGTLSDFDAQRYTHDLLLPLIWKLRHNLTAYDAAFAALAAVLDATLVTCDARMARTPWPLVLGRPISIDLIRPQ